jgi:hypothetical protein
MRRGNHASAVVTLALGAKARAILALTRPLMAAYAARIGAEFVVIDSFGALAPPHANKYQLADLLERFHRIIYLDCDALVHPDCPDLTEIVPATMLGCLVEDNIVPRDNDIRAATQSLGPLAWERGFFNSGVMVISREHRDIFTELRRIHAGPIGSFFEQNHLNWLVRRERIAVFDLGHRYNHMTISGWPTADARILHFAHTGFRPTASGAAADVYAAKRSDIQDMLNAASGVLTWTFDAERFHVIDGAVERSAEHFSRLVSAAPHRGLVGRSMPMALARGRYALVVEPAAASDMAAAMRVKVTEFPRMTVLAEDSRGLAGWSRPLSFDVLVPSERVMVELLAEGGAVAVEAVTISQQTPAVWHWLS